MVLNPEKSGDLRNEDGNTAYGMRASGQLPSVPFAEHVFGQEDLDLSQEEFIETTEELFSPEEYESQSDDQTSQSDTLASEKVIQDELQRTIQDPTDRNSTSTPNDPSGTHKILGNANLASGMGGLDLDDEIDGDAGTDTNGDSDDDEDDGSDPPDPPPAPGTGTGVSPNLPEPDSTVGGDSAPVISTSRAEIDTGEAISPIGDETGPGSVEDADPIYAEGSDPLTQRNMEIKDALEATSEDNRYFLGKLSDQNMITEAVDNYLSNLHNEGAEVRPLFIILESLYKELNKLISNKGLSEFEVQSATENISQAQDFKVILESDKQMMEDALEELGEDEVITLTYSRCLFQFIRSKIR